MTKVVIADHEFDVRQPMVKADWEAVEDFYADAVNSIIIPEELDPADMLSLNAKLSKIFTQARFDYMYIKRQYDKIKRQMKRAEKQAYMAVRGLGKNDKEREGLVNEYLQKNNLFGYPVTMFDAIDIYEERCMFMEAVLDDIREKASRLITSNGALKLDIELQR